jgi:hypothetical protein
MSKSIKTLRDDLSNLSDEVQVLATKLNDSYKQYLTVFIDAVSRQLIVVGYQICTQKYPESFLDLTYNERVKLQQNLKSLNKLFKEELSKYLSEIKIDNQKLSNDFQLTFSELNLSEPKTENLEIEEEEQSENQESLTVKNNEELDLLAPEILLKLVLDIDLSLSNSLSDLSRLANNYLQDSGILPSHIPAKILEMALQSEESSIITNTSPNLLTLLVEEENRRSKESKNITPITAICLRISEIEFAESTLNNARNKIRNIMSKIEKISDLFSRKKQEYTIACAESAWRSSWYEET